MYRWLAILTCLAFSMLAQSDKMESSQLIKVYNPPDHLTSNSISEVQSEYWTLVFEDYFEGSELDADKWATCYWWHRHWETQGCTNEANNELQWYLPENIIVDNGTLKLLAQEQTGLAVSLEGEESIYQYTSGMVTTGRMDPDISSPAQFSFQYGYAEIRARVPAGRGLLSAIWLLPDNHHYRPEVDVMEILGHEPDTVYGYIHHPDYSASFRSWTGPDLSADWHIFAIDWQPDEIIWYVDGVAFFRYTNTETIPDTPMYLLLTLAVGGKWPGEPDAATVFPNYFEIDYVQVWQRSPELTQDPGVLQSKKLHPSYEPDSNRDAVEAQYDCS